MVSRIVLATRLPLSHYGTRREDRTPDLVLVRHLLIPAELYGYIGGRRGTRTPWVERHQIYSLARYLLRTTRPYWYSCKDSNPDLQFRKLRSCTVERQEYVCVAEFVSTGFISPRRIGHTWAIWPTLFLSSFVLLKTLPSGFYIRVTKPSVWGIWGFRWDSNSQPTAYKAVALPLCYESLLVWEDGHYPAVALKDSCALNPVQAANVPLARLWFLRVLSTGVWFGIRTRKILILSQACLPIASIRHLVPRQRLERWTYTLEECCTSSCATEA